MGSDKSAAQPHEEYVIVLIDGVCHMCHGLTRFIIQRDPAGIFRFASQQSEIGQELLRQNGLPQELNNTVVVLEKNRYYTESAAALRISRHLPMPWSLWYGGILIPRFLRDALYQWIANNRYRWFGKDQECMIPTPEIRSRFL
ncbi:thiol-disulfide oxidoreductase DCC family protein [Paenibacillus lemnae]|uniref:Thiol-disulfide oxidoreductase DCC family protein n=2 Tax=Paenibacillus lemnae TaxID=1330551 RepID=A0A848M6A6_PAELE|nr:thiol-disulfide oxidoreductase DCC family protein [Paenibacillus lemnae]NMO95789.1 thiol-disulfide oxidoreductase DCC family protein [Paenibacillus lemnae]